MENPSKYKYLFELALECNQYVIGDKNPDIEIIDKFLNGFMRINHDKETQKKLIYIIAGLDDDYVDSDIVHEDINLQTRYMMAMDFVMEGLIDNHNLSIADNINQRKRMIGLAGHFHQVVEEGINYDINDLCEFLDKIDLVKGSSIENTIYATFLSVDEEYFNPRHKKYNLTKEKLINNISILAQKLKEDLSNIDISPNIDVTRTLDDGYKIHNYGYNPPFITRTIH